VQTIQLRLTDRTDLAAPFSTEFADVLALRQPAADEYFNGDNGANLGTNHQTGWTGLVITLIRDCRERSPPSNPQYPQGEYFNCRSILAIERSITANHKLKQLSGVAIC